MLFFVHQANLSTGPPRFASIFARLGAYQTAKVLHARALGAVIILGARLQEAAGARDALWHHIWNISEIGNIDILNIGIPDLIGFDVRDITEVGHQIPCINVERLSVGAHIWPRVREYILPLTILEQVHKIPVHTIHGPVTTGLITSRVQPHEGANRAAGTGKQR